MSDLFGVEGRQRLARVPLGAAYAQRMSSLLELIDVLDTHERRFAEQIAAKLYDDRGYGRFSSCPVLARSSVRYSSPRSVMCTASPTPATCVRGPD